jgi:hypothetical protein
LKFPFKIVNYYAKDDKKLEKRINGFLKLICIELLENNILLNLPKRFSLERKAEQKISIT